MGAIYLTVAGRLATAPERQVTDRGATRVSFRVASNERRYNPSAEAWAEVEPVYLRVTCWRELAESVYTSLRIGDPVIVHGKLLSRSFDREGRTQTVHELGADAVGPDLKWSTAVVTRRKPAAEAPREGADGPVGGPVGNGHGGGPVPVEGAVRA